jgi:hypothetical protein
MIPADRCATRSGTRALARVHLTQVEASRNQSDVAAYCHQHHQAAVGTCARWALALKHAVTEANGHVYACLRGPRSLAVASFTRGSRKPSVARLEGCALLFARRIHRLLATAGQHSRVTVSGEVFLHELMSCSVGVVFAWRRCFAHRRSHTIFPSSSSYLPNQHLLSHIILLQSSSSSSPPHKPPPSIVGSAHSAIDPAGRFAVRVPAAPINFDAFWRLFVAWS